MRLKQRIQHDIRRVAGDPEASALLACLVQHLFDPNLDSGYLGKVCGASRELRDRLAAAVGPLKGYISELRMIEAQRLVWETDLSNQEIAERLGYRSLRTFYRIFKEHHRLTPKQMRQQARPEPAGAPDPAAAPDPETAVLAAVEGLGEVAEAAQVAQEVAPERLPPRARAARWRRRAAIESLDATAVGELRSQLRRRHPKLEEAPADEDPSTPSGPRFPLILMPTRDHLERYAAGAVFDRILALPEADVRHAMLEGVRTGTSTAFDLLYELCFGHTRWNPEGAVAVAELGVQMLEIHRDVMADAADDWKALTWARLARVKMLASDFAGASRALDFAWQESAEMASWAELEVRRVEGMVHMHRGRGELAASALARAVELGRELPLSDPKRVLSIAESLELVSLLGDTDTGLQLCSELDALIDAGAAGIDRVEFWRALVAYHQGKAHAAAGRDDHAEVAWRQASWHVGADQAATEPPGAAVYETAVLGSFVVHELARLSGRYRNFEGYETLLRDALARYQLIRTPVLEAAAEAELAALLALRGGGAEARRLATSAADFLDALPCHRRAWNAATRLRALADRDAEAAEEELADILAALCDDLDSLRWEITGAQAMPAVAQRKVESPAAGD